MSGGQKKWARISIAALYALTMMFVALTASSHLSSPGASSLDERISTAAGVSPSVICAGFDRNDGDGSAPDSMSCCDACTLTSAPGLNVVAATHLVYVLEISTRFDFFARLGRAADARPDDLRSRAPPRFS